MVDVTVTERRRVAIASIMARHGTTAEMIGAAVGLDLSNDAVWVGSSALMMLGYGPGCWLAFAEPEPDDWMTMLRAKLDGIASIADQSAAYSILRLSGGGSGSLLQRGIAIDLHPSSFNVKSVAVTQVAHIGVIVWQVNTASVFDIAIPRSFAKSFRRWLNNDISLVLD